MNVRNKILFKLYQIRFLRKYILRVILKKDPGFAFSDLVRQIFKHYHGIEIGYGSYGGCFNPINIPRGVKFGRYCSIAQNVKIFNADHPKNSFTLHPLFYNPRFGYVKKDKLDRQNLIVGNDVWIGDNTVILSKVKHIGDGAIIGAGSIVTKNVEPFTIVAGNPAKVIGERFNNEEKKTVLESKWWELSKDELIKRQPEISANLHSRGT